MPKTQKKKANMCSALNAAGTECSLPPARDGALWCQRHNEERLKLYTNYKAHGSLLKAYPSAPEYYNVATIMTCDNLSVLREWNGHLRGKYNLLTRCIEARICFTRRFFGEDMDFGHKVFWDNLVQKRTEVEQLMSHIETRGYQLILEGQSALWVLEQDTPDTGDCSGHGGFLQTTASPQPADDAEDVKIEDPLEAILREKAMESRDRTRLFLAGFCASPTSRFYDERLEVIYAYVRRAIYKDASLVFLSQNYDSVMALLTDQDLDFVTMEKIWEVFDALRIHDIHAAVDDVVRSTDGEHMVVLGGKVFKNVSGERWPLHAWGHVMAIRRCYSCLRVTCKTVDQVIDVNRYAVLTGAPLSQTFIKFNYSFDGSKELMLAGFIPNGIPFSLPRHSIVYKESGSYSNSSVWEETERNLSLSGGLSLSDPKAQAFVNACIRHPDFMVMLRKGPAARIIRSRSVVWLSRKRRAQSRLALASTPWDSKAADVVILSDSALEDSWPHGWKREKIIDCMQVIIVDASEDMMGDFIRKLVALWCQVYQVDGKDGLHKVFKDLCEVKGELEAYEEVTIPIALRYHQNLWGCKPGPPYCS